MIEERYTSVELSRDELAFILTLHNLTEISGFAVPAEFDSEAVAAAGESLAARGLVVEGDTGRAVHPDVAALATSGALYQTALGISALRDGAIPTQSWFYVSSEQIVFHHAPPDASQIFELIRDADHLADYLAQLVPFRDDDTSREIPQLVEKAWLAEAEALQARDGPETAVEALTARGLPADFAGNVMEESAQTILVNIRVQEDDTGHVHANSVTYMLIAGCWWMREDDSDPERLYVERLNGETGIERVLSLLGNEED